MTMKGVLFLEDKKLATKKHEVTLLDRERLTVDGILNVDSFDEHEAILETEAGVLEIRGRELHVRELNVDVGSLIIEGFIQSLEYTAEPGSKRKGLFGRLLK